MNIRENIWRWGEGSKANSSGIQAGYGAAIELRGFREQEERKRNSHPLTPDKEKNFLGEILTFPSSLRLRY